MTLPEGESVDSEAVTADLEALDAALAEALPELPHRLVSPRPATTRSSRPTGPPSLPSSIPSPTRTPQFGENPEAEKAASAALEGATVAGSPVHLTGFDALFEDSGEDADGPSLLIEALIGGFGALLVLIFVFASFLAVVPLLMAFVSIMTTFLLLLGLTEVTTVSPIVQFLIALIGLGVAIDYSLIVVSRWREERTHGASDEEAVQIAMEHAGRAVVFSRHHGRDRALGADRAAASVPALDGLRRHADPARLDPRRDHAPPRPAREVRRQARLAAPAHGRQGKPRLDPVGRGRLPPPLARCRAGHGVHHRARRRLVRASARHLRREHARLRAATPRTASTRSSTRASARARSCRTRS